MAQIDPAYILQLVDASQALDDAKKAEIKSRLTSLNPEQLAEIQRVLIDEQRSNAEYYRQLSEIKIKATERKIKIIHDYSERALKREDAKNIDELEDQLAQL